MSLKHRNKNHSITINDFGYCPPGIPPDKWEEMMETRERDEIVLSLREEILSNVFNQCQKIYEERKSIDLLVECAHEAWKQIICLYFLEHETVYKDKLSDSNWSADKVCPPCKPDSLAVNNLPMKHRKMYSKIKKFESNITLADEYSLRSEQKYTSKAVSVAEEEKILSTHSKTPCSIMSTATLINIPKESYGSYGSISDSTSTPISNFTQVTSESSHINVLYMESLSLDTNASLFTRLKKIDKEKIPKPNVGGRGIINELENIHHRLQVHETVPQNFSKICDIIADKKCHLIKSDESLGSKKSKITNKKSKLPKIVTEKKVTLTEFGKGLNKLGQDDVEYSQKLKDLKSNKLSVQAGINKIEIRTQSISRPKRSTFISDYKVLNLTPKKSIDSNHVPHIKDSHLMVSPRSTVQLEQEGRCSAASSTASSNASSILRPSSLGSRSSNYNKYVTK